MCYNFQITNYSFSLKAGKDNTDMKNMILYSFTKFTSKNFKKSLLKIIDTLDLTYAIINSTAKEIFEKITQRQCCIKHCIWFFNFVSLMESYIDYDQIVPLLFPIYYQIFAGFVYHLL